MKRCLLAMLLIITVGCAQQAWYQPGKSLQDAVRDFEECKYESLKSSGGQSQAGIYNRDTEVLVQCMRLRGYSYIDVSNLLKNNEVKIQNVDPIKWRLVQMPFYMAAGK